MAKAPPKTTTSPDTTQRAAKPRPMMVEDPHGSIDPSTYKKDTRPETDEEMVLRVEENKETLGEYLAERASYPLATDAFADLLRQARTFDVDAVAAPNADSDRLVIRTLVTLAPPLRKAGSRRLAFDGTRWTADRAADRAAAWIAPACEAILRQQHPTFLRADGTLRDPTDPVEFDLEGLPPCNPVRDQLARWRDAPSLAVDALYRALPDLGADALREDPVEMLNTPAGVISLRGGSLLNPSPAPPARADELWVPTPTRDFVHCTGVVPAETVSQLWLDFLADALPDPHTRDWTQRLCGYFASGRYNEDLNVWLLGETRTGKTTFAGAVAAALGSYALKHDSTRLLRSQTTPLRLTNDERGIRLLRMAEMEERYQVDGARLKDLSGGDETPGGWLPQFTILVDTNHPPNIVDHSGATAARMRVIPFTVRRLPHQIDTSLRQRLWTTETPGVLRWMLDGGPRYFKQGLLDVPDAIVEATEAVLAAQDPEGSFYRQLHASAEPVPFKTLYDTLVGRCVTANKRVPGRNLVSARLAARGFPAVAGAHNQRVVYARLGSGDGEAA